MKKVTETYHAIIKANGERYIAIVRFEGEDVSALIYTNGGVLPLCSYYGVGGAGGITPTNYVEILTNHLIKQYG